MRPMTPEERAVEIARLQSEFTYAYERVKEAETEERRLISEYRHAVEETLKRSQKASEIAEEISRLKGYVQQAGTQ